MPDGERVTGLVIRGCSKLGVVPRHLPSRDGADLTAHRVVSGGRAVARGRASGISPHAVVIDRVALGVGDRAASVAAHLILIGPVLYLRQCGGRHEQRQHDETCRRLRQCQGDDLHDAVPVLSLLQPSGFVTWDRSVRKEVPQGNRRPGVRGVERRWRDASNRWRDWPETPPVAPGPGRRAPQIVSDGGRSAFGGVARPPQPPGRLERLSEAPEGSAGRKAVCPRSSDTSLY